MTMGFRIETRRKNYSSDAWVFNKIFGISVVLMAVFILLYWPGF